jgi:hypothetical protein
MGVVYIPLGIQVFFMFFMLLAAGMAYEAYIRPKLFLHVFIPIKKEKNVLIKHKSLETASILYKFINFL